MVRSPERLSDASLPACAFSLPWPCSRPARAAVEPRRRRQPRPADGAPCAGRRRGPPPRPEASRLHDLRLRRPSCLAGRSTSRWRRARILTPTARCRTPRGSTGSSATPRAGLTGIFSARPDVGALGGDAGHVLVAGVLPAHRPGGRLPSVRPRIAAAPARARPAAAGRRRAGGSRPARARSRRAERGRPSYLDVAPLTRAGARRAVRAPCGADRRAAARPARPLRVRHAVRRDLPRRRGATRASATAGRCSCGPARARERRQLQRDPHDPRLPRPGPALHDRSALDALAAQRDPADRRAQLAGVAAGLDRDRRREAPGREPRAAPPAHPAPADRAGLPRVEPAALEREREPPRVEVAQLQARAGVLAGAGEPEPPRGAEPQEPAGGRAAGEVPRPAGASARGSGSPPGRAGPTRAPPTGRTGTRGSAGRARGRRARRSSRARRGRSRCGAAGAAVERRREGRAARGRRGGRGRRRRAASPSRRGRGPAPRRRAGAGTS